jgi:DNA (cytosine-5)-methyltransferase 1
MKIIHFIDLFAGIGGFRYGLESAGPFKCVWSNEWDKYASAIYKKHYGECDTRDITKIGAGEVPDHDLLCGGFPCQSFSIAGKRLGFDEARGTLFYEIARILSYKRPRYLLLENVKGLLNHDGGKTFETILGVLTDLGYECQWQVLNSKDFGVPQNRERIFIVGNLREEPRPQVFPVRQNGGLYTKDDQESPAQVSRPLRASPAGKSDSQYIVHNIYGGFKETKARRFDRISPTIRTPKGGGHIPDVVNGARIRKLTPVECERLQGFPDNWTAGISDTQRYKCLGNAVTTNVVAWIGRQMLTNLT